MSAFNDLRSYSRRWVKAFIETYKNEASLWQMSHQDYTNNNVRNLAYDKLVEKLKEVEQNPDRNMVVKKINSLRSAFRREYRKKISDKNYVPRLWYYDIMLFIAEQKTTSRKSTNGRKKSVYTNKKVNAPGHKKLVETYRIDNDTLSIQQDESENEENIELYEETEEETMVNNSLLSEPDINTSSVKQEVSSNSNPMPVRILQVTNIEPIMETQTNQQKSSEINHTIEQSFTSHHQQTHDQQAQHQHDQHQQQGPVIQSIQLSKEQLHAFLNSGSSITSTPMSTSIQQLLDDSPTITTKMNNNNSNIIRHRHDDEFDAIGYNVASKLRVMNPTQRIIAEKLISDVLFSAQLDSLTISSKIVS